MTEKDKIIQDQRHLIEEYKTRLKFISNALKNVKILEEPGTMSEMIISDIINICEICEEKQCDYRIFV